MITGGPAGVGRAIAPPFARSGARIALLARGAERLEAAKREGESLGGQAIVHAGDVADPAVTEALAARTEETFGPVDVWVSKAMTSVAPRSGTRPPTRSGGSRDPPGGFLTFPERGRSSRRRRRRQSR